MSGGATVDLVTETARRLVPGVLVTARPIVSRKTASPSTVRDGDAQPHHFSIPVNESSDRLWRFEFDRPDLPISNPEWDVLSRLPEAVALCSAASPGKRGYVAHLLSNRLTLEHVLVALLLRKAPKPGIARPMLVLESLMDLSFRRYEGTEATTGLIYTSAVDEYLRRIKADHPYTFSRFERQLEVSPTVFAAPAAFRYVDGRNSFYLLNKPYKIVGVLRSKSPSDFSIMDRCSHRHVRPLISGMPGRAWLGYVGLNNDIHVVRAGGVHLHWHHHHWHVRNADLIGAVLQRHGCAAPTSDFLVTVLNTLSELRLGALVLIPHDAAILPTVVGKIDLSPLADELRRQITSTNLAALVKANGAVGVFSSDGLTTVSKDGRIVSCGDILDLGKIPSDLMSGGGRSQAARAASGFGLAIKVSEDGPITIFNGGKSVLTI